MIINGMKPLAAADGVDIFVYASYILWGEDADRMNTKLNLFRMFDPADYDGAIMLTNTFNSAKEQNTIVERFGDLGVPIISAEVEVPGTAFVGTSNYKGMYELGRHLIEVHHVKNVVYVSGIEGNEECALRRKALEEALAVDGLTISDTVVGNFAFYNAADNVREWLDAGHQLPDAFVCANDQMALGVISELYEKGIDVPGDVIVTGFDFVKEAQNSYPLLATVSRQWDQMGANLYRELKEQIDNPNPEHRHIYDSAFIPSESCGCEPDEKAIKTRLDKVRNVARDTIHNDMVDFMFQEIRGAMTKVSDREGFYEAACRSLRFTDYIGMDYSICIDPHFIDSTDDDYVPYYDGYPDRMEVLFERREGEPAPQKVYDSREIYPGYRHTEGGSEIYVITPLTHLEYNIGYVGIKNHPEVLYDLRFKKWINNMDTLLISIRQYMISQRLNNKLKEIYMTDFLTGMYNRTGCEDVLFKFILSEKAENRRTMLIFTDIDCMKMINDVYGHLNGDLAIKATAESMKRSLPDDWMMGRFGGDEFVAVGPDDGRLTIEEYRRVFNGHMKDVIADLNVRFRLTASAGYCMIDPDSEGTIEDYIRGADASMYEQKEIAHREINALHG